MPNGSLWRMSTARSSLAALSVVLICATASAQSVPGVPYRSPSRFGNAAGSNYGNGTVQNPWQRQPYQSENRMDRRPYGYGPTPGPWFGLSVPRYVPGVGGDSTWPSRPPDFGQPGNGANPPIGVNQENWPPRPYNPAPPSANTEPADPNGYPRWQSPPQTADQPSVTTGPSGDGVRPTVRPHRPTQKPRPVTARPAPAPRAQVPPLQTANPPPAVPPQNPVPSEPPMAAPPPTNPESPAASPPPPVEPPQTPAPPQQPAASPDPLPSQPTSPSGAPPPPSREALTPLDAIAIAGLALALLLIARAMRRFRRRRQQRRAQIVLIRDTGDAQMTKRDPADAGPIIGLRLLTETPVTRLCKAA
jgi:hypothetical protein